MGQIFDFGNLEKNEKTIKETWYEFRDCLAKGLFTYKEIDKAKEQIFLKVYDDLFCQNSGIEHQTITIGELKSQKIGRGTILNDTEVPDYERFLPKTEFIREDNRFSPSGVEWLYMAIGTEDDIRECARAECRAKVGNRFGFCQFQFEDVYDECRLVDLTIADHITYEKINSMLEDYGQAQVEKNKKIRRLGFVPKQIVNEGEFKQLLTRWGVYTYAKLLSEQIFVPLEVGDNKMVAYAPFQTMAQYYISLGYSGIVYGSTVCSKGKNIVLFDKKMAFPIGEIEDYFV